MLEALAKFGPMALVLAINAVTAWAAWSMRQFAKSEVHKIVDAAVARLIQRDDGLASDVQGHGDRILTAEGQINEIRKDILDLPTKADVARIEGEVKGVSNQVSVVASGVHRLEGYFLKEGVEGKR